MKTKLLLLALVSLPVAAFAANAATVAGIPAADFVLWLTPVLVPLLIAGLKKYLPFLPTYMLPILAPILGVGLDFINGLATAHVNNFWIAAALGLAGVGVREIKDQLTPQKADAASA